MTSPRLTPSRRGRARSVFAALAVLSALGLGACGGSSTGSVIASANAICESTQAAIRSEPASATGLAGSARLVAREVRQLRALTRPASRRALLNRFLAAEATVAVRYRSLAIAASAQRPDVASEAAALTGAARNAAALAGRYGISRCAVAGATAGSS